MSSSLKLYHAIESPPSRACLMLLRTLGLDVEVKIVKLAACEQNSPEFLKLNPIHQVPVLVDGDFVLSESRAIMAYLVNKYKPGNDFYPSDPRERAVVDSRLYYDAVEVFDSGATIIRLALLKGVKKISDEHRERLVNSLVVLDGFLTTSKWIAGNKITIADFSILGSITTLKELGYDFEKHPKLNAWYNECQSFEGFEENLEGAKYLAGGVLQVLDDKF